MLSRCFGIDERRVAGRRGFTLLELLLVLALVALIAGVAGISTSNIGAESRQRTSLERLVRTLIIARAKAMQRSANQVVRVELADEAISVTAGAQQWQAPAPDLIGLLSEGAAAEALEATFDTAGRTRSREWTFVGLSAGDDQERRRIWTVRFDPVSGVASLARLAESD